MDKLDSISGKKVAEAINTAISNAVHQVFEKTPYDKQRDGKIIAINNGILTVEIDKKIYTNVPVLRNAGELRIGDIVKCIIPNNQTSQMYATGVADGTLNAGNDYVLPQMTSTTLGGGRAIEKTTETNPVAIDPLTGLLYSGIEGSGTYTHEQSTASAEWNITHNLNKHPSCTIVDSAETEVQGELEYINNNSLKLTFIGAFAGKAYLN